MLSIFIYEQDSNGEERPTALPVTEANARLIAAAPDLLAALLEYVERHESEGNPEGMPEYEQARAAIAKATKGA